MKWLALCLTTAAAVVWLFVEFGTIAGPAVMGSLAAAALVWSGVEAARYH